MASILRRSMSPGNELAWMLRQLATLVQAGVPLMAALQCLQEGTLSAVMRQALRSIALALESGETFSRGLDRFPALFSDGVRMALAAAEEGGQLATTLMHLAGEQESRMRLVSKVRQALVYPIMILLTGLCVMLVVCWTVVPALRDSFVAAGHSLPAATRSLLWLTDFIAEQGVLLLVAAVLAGVLWHQLWCRNTAWRLLWVRVALHIPLWGGLLCQAALARWSRTLWLLQSAGVPLLVALPMAGAASGNSLLLDISRVVAQQVREGQGLHQAMAQTKWFPPLMIQLVRVGEQSGMLADMFERAASHFSQEVEQTLAILTSLLEPLSMMLLGILCGGLIWALYLPIFQLGDTVV